MPLGRGLRGWSEPVLVVLVLALLLSDDDDFSDDDDDDGSSYCDKSSVSDLAFASRLQLSSQLHFFTWLTPETILLFRKTRSYSLLYFYRAGYI